MENKNIKSQLKLKLFKKLYNKMHRNKWCGALKKCKRTYTTTFALKKLNGKK